MNTINKTRNSWCPFCQGNLCQHFLGWTEDGLEYQDASTHVKRLLPVLEGDKIIKTGVSARVYRKDEL